MPIKNISNMANLREQNINGHNLMLQNSYSIQKNYEKINILLGKAWFFKKGFKNLKRN